jgi:FixJ family two-component response regulator
MSPIEKPLVACATRRSEMAFRVNRVADRLGQEFLTGCEIEPAVKACERRVAACFVVDHLLVGDFCEIISACPKPVLVFIPSDNQRAAFMAGQVGALDIINNEDADDKVASCLQAAIESVAGASRRESFSAPVYQECSKREKEILECLMGGAQNKQVASMLDISLRSVEAGRANLLKKLKAGSFAELIRYVSEVEKQKSIGLRRVYESIRNKTAATGR